MGMSQTLPTTYTVQCDPGLGNAAETAQGGDGPELGGRHSPQKALFQVPDPLERRRFSSSSLAPSLDPAFGGAAEHLSGRVENTYQLSRSTGRFRASQEASGRAWPSSEPLSL